VAFETKTQMPAEFLLQQLEVRESLEAAVARKDSAVLDDLRKKLLYDKKEIETLIAQSIDFKKDYAAAAEQVRKLMFLQRLDEEIDSAYEAIE
jgi:molecular chaperone HscB